MSCAEDHLNAARRALSADRPVILELKPSRARKRLVEQEDALAALGIRVVGYTETDQGFAFRVGREVAAARAGRG